ncbi:MAG: hypothetical protein J6386_09710 [Candidatus Synoicihabitans palmerolidicus]|nr:hypothetical protein [Candidatus Synoicihabitans palmerolidicus]
MSDSIIADLQQELATANESVERLTAANAALTAQLSEGGAQCKEDQA